MTASLRALGLLILTALAAPAQAAEPLVADLSRHLVAITTGFSGADLLLFGAVEGDGDVVVVVRGPAHPQTLRQKARRGGIWVNAASAEVEGAPSFYRVAASRPLDEIAPPPVLRRHQIGLDHLRFEIGGRDAAATGTYRAALIRLKQRAGLYGSGVQDVGFIGQRLFRTDMRFPANVPVGTYMVEIYLLRDGQVAGAQTTPLVVSKIGLGADVHEFAHRHALPYGIIAVMLAAFAGWVAAVAFRKG